MKKQTLLEKAMAINPSRRRRITAASDEELELMLAMIRGEITTGQASHALGKTHRNMSQDFYAVVRAGVLDGRITIKHNNGKCNPL